MVFEIIYILLMLYSWGSYIRENFFRQIAVCIVNEECVSDYIQSINLWKLPLDKIELMFYSNATGDIKTNRTEHQKIKTEKNK